MAALLAFIEALSYGAARGFWRAYFDVLGQGSPITKEKVTSEDADILARFSAALRGVQSPAAPGSPGRPNEAAPVGAGPDAKPPAGTA